MISRAVYPKRRGRRWLAAGAILTLVSGTLLIASNALAVHDEGVFELDISNSAAICAPLPAPCGDANVADDAAPGDDWATIFAGGGSAIAAQFIPDPVSQAENSFFTGGGSKDTRDVPAWQYGTTNDVIPDKDDIADAFAAAYHSGTDTIIYFGMDRYDNNGDAEAGFWFFQDTVSLGPNGQFNGVHTVGDVLVLANWGGSNPVGEITVYQWVGGKNPLALVADNTAADCATIGANDNVCAVVNRQTVDPPWPFIDKGGSQDIRPVELFEAGINLNALFGEERCFGSFLASTRSSHSTTAQLKDFALGPFEACVPELSTVPSAGAGGTVAPGVSVTDTVTIQGTGVADPPEPTGDVTFFLCGPIASGVCDTGGTNIGTGTLADTSPPAGEAQATSPAVNTVGNELDSGRYCFRAEWPGDDNYDPAPEDNFVHFGTGDEECFYVLDTSTVTTKQIWLPNDEGTVASDNGGSVKGTLSFTLHEGGDCTGAVLRAAEVFTLNGSNDTETRTTTNTTVTVEVSKTVSWKVVFAADADSGALGSEHCETTTLVITN